MKHYCEEKERVLEALNTTEAGLSGEEASQRQSREGKNKLREPKGKSLAARFLEQLADPMILILLAAAAVSGVLGYIEGEGYTDVIIILSVVLLNAILGVYQESKAEKAIEALQQMSAATCKVLRDGMLTVLPSEELVPGDVVLLEAGDAVPADGRLLQAAALKIEEAALTGESVPAEKTTDALQIAAGEHDVPLGDRRNMVYMGSSVVYGRGVAVITGTGMNTEMGKIADALAQAEDGDTPLQIKLRQLSKILTWLVLGICLAIFAVQMLRAGGLSLRTTLDSLMIAVSLAVAAIPEGLAAVVTVVLSLGVTHMAKRNAIIRKLSAVETLGCAQIICSDKTGTLTQNKMTVVDFFGDNEADTASAMALCSDAELGEHGEVTGEPTEAALVVWANKLGRDKNVLKSKYLRCAEAPFDSLRKCMSTVHVDGDHFVQYTKGAPDVVLSLCTHYWKDGKAQPMTDEARALILKRNKAMADRALRVLACASRSWDVKPIVSTPEALEQGLCFMGLCGMIDPVRPEVAEAIVRCRAAGIRPIMITGDHVDTAAAIARELGILSGDAKAITGSQLSRMDDETFEKEFRNISVYARVQPEHKTRIVKAWQKAGYVTAMTGDGVNDAPSIKSADIGVGMGITGTDVTKSVADMILTDDNFATIVSAVAEGRRIYDNIRKAIQFLLSANLAEVLAVFISTLLGFTIFRPVHILWINLITDTFPAISLGMEEAESDTMNRPPRSPKESIFAGGLGFDVILEGCIISALTILSYFTGYRIENGVWGIGQSPAGMTMAFLTLSMMEIFHSFNLRSRRRSLFTLPHQNKWLWGTLVFSTAITAAVVFIPALRNVFSFAPVSLKDYGLAMLIAVSIIPIMEIVKFFSRLASK